MMNFQDAVQNMLSGKRVIRSGWGGYYLTILQGQSYIWTVPTAGNTPTVNASIFIPTVDDITATDYMLKIN